MSSGRGGRCASQAPEVVHQIPPTNVPGRKTRAGSKRALTRRMTASAPGSGTGHGCRRRRGHRPATVHVPGRERGADRGHATSAVAGTASQDRPSAGPRRRRRRRARAAASITRGQVGGAARDLDHDAVGAALPGALRGPDAVVVGTTETSSRRRRARPRRARAPGRGRRRSARAPAAVAAATPRPGWSPRAAGGPAPRAAAASRPGRRDAPTTVAVPAGSGCSRTATEAIRPSVPYEPVNSLPRSYPATFLMTFRRTGRRCRRRAPR